MFSRQRLFWHRGPYDLPSTDQLFLQATADCCAFHMARCPQYRAIAEHLGFSPDQLRTMDDLVRVPMLPTLFFKRHALFSMPRRRMVMKVTSSGTSGTSARWASTWAASGRRSPWSSGWAGGTGSSLSAPPTMWCWVTSQTGAALPASPAPCSA